MTSALFHQLLTGSDYASIIIHLMLKFKGKNLKLKFLHIDLDFYAFYKGLRYS